MKLIWADAGYSDQLVDWVKVACGWVLEMVTRRDDVKGFQVLPHRWIVEHTFGRLGRYRRLSKDYEGLTESSQAFIYAAIINIMIKDWLGSNLEANEKKFNFKTVS